MLHLLAKGGKEVIRVKSILTLKAQNGRLDFISFIFTLHYLWNLMKVEHFARDCKHIARPFPLYPLLTGRELRFDVFFLGDLSFGPTPLASGGAGVKARNVGLTAPGWLSFIFFIMERGSAEGKMKGSSGCGN